MRKGTAIGTELTCTHHIHVKSDACHQIGNWNKKKVPRRKGEIWTWRLAFLFLIALAERCCYFLLPFFFLWTGFGRQRCSTVASQCNETLIIYNEEHLLGSSGLRTMQPSSIFHVMSKSRIVMCLHNARRIAKPIAETSNILRGRWNDKCALNSIGSWRTHKPTGRTTKTKHVRVYAFRFIERCLHQNNYDNEIWKWGKKTTINCASVANMFFDSFLLNHRSWYGSLLCWCIEAEQIFLCLPFELMRYWSTGKYISNVCIKSDYEN